MNARVLRGTAVAALVFLLVQLGALALAAPFEAAGYRAVEDPSDPVNSVVYVLVILVATALMLAAFRYGLDWLIRAMIVFAGASLAWYVFSVVVPPVPVGGVAVLPAALAAAVGVALYVYPEWYVIDVAGVVMGAGGAGLFGISFGLLPAILLLAVLAVYDAISVYGTRHMLDLAEGVMDLRVPVVLVIPLVSGYSMLAGDPAEANPALGGEAGGTPDAAETGAGGTPDGGAEDPDAGAERVEESAAEVEAGDEDGPPAEATDRSDDDPIERDVLFVGLGDAVLPAVLVASAAVFSPAPSIGFAPLPALNLPALFAMAGIFAGLGGLLRAVFGGRAHAGLPLLNGGAIAGYLVGSALAGVGPVAALGLAAYL